MASELGPVNPVHTKIIFFFKDSFKYFTFTSCLVPGPSSAGHYMQIL
jgi:hypothetical protein